MTTAGIHGVITDGKGRENPCMMIGDYVPRFHHSDGLPVYMVIESEQGMPVYCKDKSTLNLLAYPSHLPAPGAWNPDLWIFASHENLPWKCLIPLFDRTFETVDSGTESILDACYDLAIRARYSKGERR